ncbi:FHA domain-containing protein [Nocardia sp. NPDC048505]|uniref:FHA domain-containing protein n=1 Tax=unclassified Nocardia TaxID=2637762 RepID=UPI0033F46233
MKDLQVEVVAGTHAIARAAGAVVVVAHREPGPPGPESTAARALAALTELVREATRQAPRGPGALVARQATRWLMKHAEQISPGVPIDFGLLSAAENGGIAIFLHGNVTALLAGVAGVEHFRGRDAAFTVDRVAALPAHAVALFVDETDGPLPELPAAPGIGRLVEGVAPGAGAVVWSAGPPGEFAETSAAQPYPLPTARIDPEPRDRRPEPRAHSETSVHDQDPHHARTEQGDLEPGGTNPAPRPDPDLQARLEATAKATSLVVKVRGFKCARAHPSDPRAAFCTVCGMPVDQTQAISEVIRPPLGMLILDDGMTYMLAADAVLGRDPEHSEPANRGLVPLKVEDTSGGMSRAHAEIRLVNWDVTLVDRGSTNGTRTRLPGYRDWIRLTPNQPMVLIPGTEVMIGNRVLRYEPAAPPPFG